MKKVSKSKRRKAMRRQLRYLGRNLNELGDVASDAALYLPFAMVPGINAAMVVVFVMLSIISEMSGVVAVQIGAQRRYAGPIGKSDRAVLFGLIGLLLGLGTNVHLLVNVVIAIASALLILTIKNRAQSALKEVMCAFPTSRRQSSGRWEGCMASSLRPPQPICS